MNKLMRLLALSLFLSGCVTTGGTMENPDNFVRAAVSWEGGSIKEMIGVWGSPTEMVTPNEYTPGFAVWDDNQLAVYDEETEKEVAQIRNKKTTKSSCYGRADQWGNVNVNCNESDEGDLEASSYKLGRNAGRGWVRICQVSVQFDDAGTITKVTANSKWCERDYGERLDGMRRPGTAAFPDGQ